MALFQILINNQKYEVDVEANKPLLWVLRDELSLTGTKYGCGIGQCGACTVHLNGTPIRSCGISISTLGDSKITTIEGLKSDNPILKAWEEINVPQCGYCQAGQIMSAVALLNNNENPNDKEIDVAMNGNICRCGTYYRMRKAIKTAVKK
ncbi:(2Fe-2S)-binding protein [Flavobacteriaceae bacterium F89]|uniref:(2Fe-2S)-binding protein n=1 Tax=Cerina litoralis TaxID=2874477 RepID=A0AAE3ERD9_9FLAO|nr:(2Fe-2S)-binding protein [Cerina litoralis]MCG2459777.1 (2Fe-2S)-binding protein [Cerina litoralis]